MTILKRRNKGKRIAAVRAKGPLLRRLSYTVTLLGVAWLAFMPHCLKARGLPDTLPWYADAIIYSLEVGTFRDSDLNGVGDFRGLSERLGYLDSLGINTIWLAPFMPSPGKDDGYDVSDYFTINPLYGSMQDFDSLLISAEKKGIRVICDLVLNHTSDEHPWFEAGRRVSSKYHSWYVWSERRPKDANKGMVFPGVQKETWSYDSLSGRYYFHRFYRFQPDLNYTSAGVRDQAFRIIRFWLQKGLHGFRMDALPFIIDIPETGSDNPDRMMELLPMLRNSMRQVNQDALLLGEANLSPDENKDYFAGGVQMMFNFYVNQFLFYSLATEDVRPFLKAMEKTRLEDGSGRWAYFLRNHDEIDLARLTEQQRNRVYAKFGPDTLHQLYGRGIRRRLAPMLGNDLARLKMAYSLLFSMPGAVVIRYGEEIGMGDDLSLRERLSVRTPMQWSDERNAGFSSAAKPFRHVIDSGAFSYRNINVAQQQKDSSSLLHLISRLIAFRKEFPEIALGNYKMLKASAPSVVAMCYPCRNGKLILVHNFSSRPVTCTIKGEEGRAGNLLAPGAITDISALSLEEYGYRWYFLPGKTVGKSGKQP